MSLPGPLVDSEWLQRALGDPSLVAADVRWYPDRNALEAYDAGHIPGAIFVDLDGDLAGPVTEASGRHPLPSPEVFAGTMGRLGIADDSAVVAYDDAGGSYAARLWWMLSVTRHPAAVLDGGLQAWHGGLEAGPGHPRSPAAFTARPWPEEQMAGAEEVDRLRRDPGAVVLDARAAERYRGEVEPVDAVAGHIPGARNAPWPENLDPATGRFLPADQLRHRYGGLGVGSAREVVVHCGSGITACHDLLALDRAGVRGAKLYVGSWSEWIRDPDRAIATGAEPAT